MGGDGVLDLGLRLDTRFNGRGVFLEMFMHVKMELFLRFCLVNQCYANGN